jgi:predicted nuclease of restriction endonuclease-like (RecB) superfamily
MPLDTRFYVNFYITVLFSSIVIKCYVRHLLKFVLFNMAQLGQICKLKDLSQCFDCR